MWRCHNSQGRCARTMEPAGIERQEPKSLFFCPSLIFLCHISDMNLKRGQQVPPDSSRSPRLETTTTFAVSVSHRSVHTLPYRYGTGSYRYCKVIFPCPCLCAPYCTVCTLSLLRLSIKAFLPHRVVAAALSSLALRPAESGLVLPEVWH